MRGVLRWLSLQRRVWGYWPYARDVLAYGLWLAWRAGWYKHEWERDDD